MLYLLLFSFFLSFLGTALPSDGIFSGQLKAALGFVIGGWALSRVPSVLIILSQKLTVLMSWTKVILPKIQILENTDRDGEDVC